MPLATTIKLPRDVEARFPERCVRCGAPAPERRIRLWTTTISVASVMSLLFCRPFSVRVPVCRTCAPRLRMARLMRLIVTLGLIVAGVTAAIWLLGSYDGPGRRYLAVGIALLCIVPFFMLEAFFPPPIDVTAYSKTVDYEFADEEYADEFARVNGISPSSGEA
jgi:hypothetical protein